MPRGTRRGTSLQTYIALLRGINVGGRTKVSMPDLRALFVELEAQDVTTYVQSGNVVFKSPVKSPAELIDVIEKRIGRDLGVSVTVLLRTKAQLAKVLAANPLAGSGREPANLHVTFLADTPDRGRVRDLDSKDAQPDEFRLVGREVYLHCPNGYGRTKLNNAYFERRLGQAATTRNWRTVAKLVELAST